jgi:thiol:disulfide interchange protein DsbD
MKKRLYNYRFTFVLLLFVLSLNTSAQIKDPVKWSFSHERVSDTEYDLVIKAAIENKWHLYSQKLSSGGPIPTSFVFNGSFDYERIGEVMELSPVEVRYDASFKMDLKMFSNEAIFKQRVTVKSPSGAKIDGYLEFMCCDDESCLPPKAVEFEFVLPGAAKVHTKTGTGSGSKEEKIVTDSGSALTGMYPGISTADSQPDIQVIQVGTDKPQEDKGKSSEAKGIQNRASIWLFFLVSFLAGLAAILTPCVFPMIPMTVTFFMQGSENRNRAVAKGLVFGLSVVAIYTSIGFIVSLTSAGADVTSRLSTHWIPNLIFFLLFLIFAASFLGMFEIVLPSGWVNKADKQVDKGGYIGAFFMAFTLVLVSFSCTGPIIGALLVESVGGLRLKPILGMFGFSLAFALPFTILAIFPSWLGNLPKSGSWLNSVKVVLGFILLAFGFKFLSTIDQTYHLGLMSRELYLSLWIVIFTLLGFYLLGKLRLPHDSALTHISVPRLVLAIASFTFVIYMVPGLFGAPLSGISAIIPPKTSQDFDLSSFVARSGQIAGSAVPAGDGLCGPSKYSAFLQLPHGLSGYFDYRQGMECARKTGKPVFLDFKGHACSNCKEIEAKVWADPEVLKRLRNDFIIIALYTDDRTKLPEEEWITGADGRILKTIGAVNLDIEIRMFSTNTQPLYALIDYEGNLLAGPRGHDLNIQGFVEYLDAGLREFEQRKR